MTQEESLREKLSGVVKKSVIVVGFVLVVLTEVGGGRLLWFVPFSRQEILD